jgi:hypothetical protein
MATVSIRPDFPNLVIVSGADVFQPNTIAGLTPQVLRRASGLLLWPVGFFQRTD